MLYSDRPLVSICIPTYNGAKFLTETLVSAINQNYYPLEIIISDDSSNDNTLKIASEILENCSIPFLILNHKPKGIAENWNNTIRHAKGKYIKLLFQDDLLEVNCIKEMVSLIEKSPNAGLIASKRTILYNKLELNNDLLTKFLETYSDLQKNLTPINGSIRTINKTVFKLPIFNRNSPLNFIGEPSVTLFRTDILKSIGFFNSNFEQILDFEFYCRILKKYEILITSKILAQFRFHMCQTSNQNQIKPIKDYKKLDRQLLFNYFFYINTKEKFRLLFKILGLSSLGYKLYELRKLFIT